MALRNLKTQSFQPQKNQGMEIESIISAPLIAASVANAMMAKEQARFIMDFCFKKDGDNYHPVMITMSISSTVNIPSETQSDGTVIRSKGVKTIKSTFQLPLLTIIPINSLAVESVEVDFEMEVLKQVLETNQDQRNRSLQGGPSEQRAKLTGRVSYDSKERSSTNKKKEERSENSSSLKVNVKAGQLPLPTGMTTILELYSKSIRPLEVTEEQEPDPAPSKQDSGNDPAPYSDDED